MADDVKCKHYKPIDNKAGFNCINCYRWIGVECADHWAMVSWVITSRKFEEVENLMKHDGYVRGKGGIRQTRRG